mmetsp:Transcript_53870/g.122792  ORF Transcript_53870/g.122792 Transcript_53870/m.122792 type:complete len:252 (+) Transcript_53870:772-1527(+)
MLSEGRGLRGPPRRPVRLGRQVPARPGLRAAAALPAKPASGPGLLHHQREGRNVGPVVFDPAAVASGLPEPKHVRRSEPRQIGLREFWAAKSARGAAFRRPRARRERRARKRCPSAAPPAAVCPRPPPERRPQRGSGNGARVHQAAGQSRPLRGPPLARRQHDRLPARAGGRRDGQPRRRPGRLRGLGRANLQPGRWPVTRSRQLGKARRTKAKSSAGSWRLLGEEKVQGRRRGYGDRRARCNSRRLGWWF